MKRFIPRLGLNPIIVKELRSRMRGPRAFITLTIILLLTGGLMYAMLQIILSQSRYMSVLSPQVGQGLFSALAYLELMMICAITPSVTAGAISGEKEKQTYEMLMATPLSPTRILFGKLVSALSYVLLLLFAAVPLASLVFIFGGVAPGDMLRVLLVLLATAITLGVLGLFLSALFGRSGWATVASFITVLILTFGPLFLAGVYGIVQQREPPRWLLAPSPISALAAALAPLTGNNYNSVMSIFSVLGGMWNTGVAPLSATEIPRPLYHYSLPIYAGLSLVLYLAATRLVQPSRRFRLKAKEIFVGVGILVLFCGLVTGAYLMSANRYEWAAQNGPGVMLTEAPVFGPVMPPSTPEVKEVVPGYPGAPSDATPTPSPAAPQGGSPGEENNTAAESDNEYQAQVYAAVIRHIYEIDHTFGKGNAPEWPIVYILEQTNDAVGEPNQAAADPVKLDSQLRGQIAKLLNDLPADIRWVVSMEEVPVESLAGTVDDGKGVVITLGNLHMKEGDATVEVPASLYFSSTGAAGKTYILQKLDGQWRVTGATGAGWIS